MNTKTNLPLLLAILLPSLTTAATVVNVDFSRDATSPLGGIAGTLQVGTGPAPDAGTFWNDYKVFMPASGGNEGANSIVNPYVVNDLTASDGTTGTTIDVTLTSGWFRAFNSSTTSINDLQQEWVFAQNGNIGVVTVGGLNTSLRYDLYLVAPGSTTIPTAYTVGSTTQTATGAVGDGVTWTNGAQYVLFSNIAPDVSGNIVISVRDGLAPITGSGAIAAMQIVSVPEPSCLLLIGSAFALVALRRRA